MNKLQRTCAVVALCGLIFSCGDDDKESGTVSIVGKWQIESRELFECPNTDLNDTEVCTAGSTSTECGTWEFKTNGTYAVVYTGGGYAQQYEANGNGTLELCSAGGDCLLATYNINSNKLTIIESNIPGGTGACLHKWVFVKL
jgi:hypothetical protein